MPQPLRDSSPDVLGADSLGIVDLDECLASAMTERKVRWLVQSGRWQNPLPRVFAMFSGPIPYDAMLFAVVRYAGRGAALSHGTAGHRYRLGLRPASIHVTVPYPREVEAQPGITVHRSRSLQSSDVAAGSLPFTKIERTVLDLLETKPNATAALSLIGDAVRTRRTTAVRLREAITACRGARWRREVLMAMPDIEGGAHSALELLDAANRRRHGLPFGRRQKKRLKDGTEYLDVLVEEWQLHVELDGRLGHDGTRETWRDMRRDNRSEVLQLRHLRYGWADMFDRSCEVAIEQAVVLRQQGWPGPFKRCRNCPVDLPDGL
jgi:hypothetical protein